MNGEVKPGYKTTEFWLTVLASAQTMVETMKGNIPHPYGEIVLAVLVAAYSIARALAKK